MNAGMLIACLNARSYANLTIISLLIEAWRSMASGRSIDEQHVERASARAFAPAPIPVESGNNAPENPEPDEDEEFDPNDVVVDRNRSQHSVITGAFRPPTDDYDSDDSDY